MSLLKIEGLSGLSESVLYHIRTPFSFYYITLLHYITFSVVLNPVKCMGNLFVSLERVIQVTTNYNY